MEKINSILYVGDKVHIAIPSEGLQNLFDKTTETGATYEMRIHTKRQNVAVKFISQSHITLCLENSDILSR